jgi:hypothetical protein
MAPPSRQAQRAALRNAGKLPARRSLEEETAACCGQDPTDRLAVEPEHRQRQRKEHRAYHDAEASAYSMLGEIYVLSRSAIRAPGLLRAEAGKGLLPLAHTSPVGHPL